METTAILRQHVQMDDTKVLAEMDKYIRKLEQPVSYTHLGVDQGDGGGNATPNEPPAPSEGF